MAVANAFDKKFRTEIFVCGRKHETKKKPTENSIGFLVY